MPTVHSGIFRIHNLPHLRHLFLSSCMISLSSFLLFTPLSPYLFYICLLTTVCPSSTLLFHSPLPHFSLTLSLLLSLLLCLPFSPVSIQYCSYGATQLQQLVSESQLSSEEVHYMLSVLATSLTQLGEDKLGWLTDHGARTLGRATDSICLGV